MRLQPRIRYKTSPRLSLGFVVPALGLGLNLINPNSKVYPNPNN